jgi:hypothetical protein
MKNQNYAFGVLKIIIALLLFFHTPGARATTYTFTGLFSSNWSSAFAWSGGIKPPAIVPAGDAIIFQSNCNMNEAVIINCSLTYSGAFNIPVSAAVTIGATGSLNIPSISVASSGVLTINGGFVINNSFTNSGSFIVNKNISLPFQIINNGLISVNAGATLYIYKATGLTGGINNYAGGTITVSGTINMTQTNFYSESSVIVNSGGSMIAVSAGAAFVFNGSFTNSGSLNLGSSTSFSSSGTVINTSTGIINGEGSFFASNCTGVNGATITPGYPMGTGKLTIANPGNFNLGATKYKCDINFTQQGVTYDWIAAAGNIDISTATLSVNWTGGFIPSIGQSFTILTCGSRTGQFATVTIPPVAGKVFTIVYNGTSVVINVSAVLPLRLLSFTGSINQNNEAKLHWQTADEVNVLGYEIESSADGIRFTKIGFVDSKNSTYAENYSYILTQANGKVYYRLKMLDIDGRFSYSNIIILSNNNYRKTITIYPNPVSNTLYIENNGELKDAVVEIIDAAGKILLKQQYGGSLKKAIDISGLPTGVYSVNIFNNQKIVSIEKFIKQ